MGILGIARKWVNRAVAPFNVRVETLTAERAEDERLRRLTQSGHFERPAFPVLDQFRHCDPTCIIDAVKRYASELERFQTPSVDDYSFVNDYYTSPDAEVLYAMVRLFKPRRIVEVGSGNSTMLIRHSIADGGLDTRLISIDPSPRREIADRADEAIRCKVEDLDGSAVFDGLGPNDILFIDSSHEIKSGNDVLKLFLTVIPELQAGVLIHVHDVFLPYDYPPEWIVGNRWRWTEQYLLQALLQGSDRYDVLWCGYYLQRTHPEIFRDFRHPKPSTPGSVWLRKR